VGSTSAGARGFGRPVGVTGGLEATIGSPRRCLKPAQPRETAYADLSRGLALLALVAFLRWRDLRRFGAGRGLAADAVGTFPFSPGAIRPRPPSHAK